MPSVLLALPRHCNKLVDQLGIASNGFTKTFRAFLRHIVAINMDFLHTIKLLVQENDAAIDATQQAIMRVDFLLSRTFQKDFIPSENTSHELSLLLQERR
jgi:hypothetical protein